MNRAIVILPYFGKLPSTFDFFLESIKNNEKFDFLIITDEILHVEKISNIIYMKKNFEWLKKKIQAIINFPIRLETAYKLCDYKPTYGLALKEEIEGYHFWGYCDSDIILGDLAGFITDEILNDFDRIYHLGHFCLYRNVKKMNEFFLYKHNFNDCFSYNYVYKTDFICAFDEVGTKYGYGLSTVSKRIGIKEFRRIDFADAMPHQYTFVLDNLDDNKYLYFEIDNGKLFGYKEDNNNPREFAYIHLQKRKMTIDFNVNKIKYWISPTAIRNSKDIALSDAKDKKKQFDYNKLHKMNGIKTKINKIIKGALHQYFNKLTKRINV